MSTRPDTDEKVITKGSSKAYWFGAIASALAALYCYSGYAMHASLDVRTRAERWGALAWLTGAIGFLGIAVAFSVLGWRRYRRRDL